MKTLELEDLKVKGYLVLTSGENGYEQESNLFSVEDIERAKLFIKVCKKRAMLVAVLDI
jgi:hypothetical protein